MEISASFWKTIEEARVRIEDPMESVSPDLLQQTLEEKSDDEIKEFMREFYQALINLNHWPLWGAGYVIAGGMSDDGFHYFRSWIIGRGKEAYDIALANPDALSPLIPDESDVDNEPLEYIALEILETRGIDDDPREDIDDSADDDPRGEQWDEDESVLAAKYPLLSARFG